MRERDRAYRNSWQRIEEEERCRRRPGAWRLKIQAWGELLPGGGVAGGGGGGRRRSWGRNEMREEPSKTSLPEPYSVQTPRAVLPLHPAVVPVPIKTGTVAIPRCTVL
jgi:hypothetical protein